MVQVFVCQECAKEAEKTNHVDLYGTPTSLLYGCKHAIADIKRQVVHDLYQGRTGKARTPRKKALQVTKVSKVEFKDGKFVIRGRKVSPSALKPPEDFIGW